MSVDIATLGLEVKSDGVTTASQRLGKLVKDGAEAENATKRLDITWRQFTAERMSEYMRTEGGHAGAMRRMSAEWAEYKKNATSAASAVVSSTEKITQSAKSASDATGKLSVSTSDLTRLARLAAEAFSAWKLYEFVKSSIDAQLQIDRLNKLFFAAAGSASLAAKELEYVRATSERMGLDVVTTAESYGKFMASIRGTSLEGEKGRQVFESVSGAATALGLRTDETSGIFNALQQMMSKGTVQAEELRGQLGERLPGAFKMAASAMGMTTAELNKQLALGNVMAEDLLPKLAVELDKAYGKAATEGAKSAQAAINRFNNSLLESKATLGSALIPVFTDVLNAIRPALELLKQFVGGIEILAVKAASIPDKLAAAWDNVKSGRGMFSKEGLDAYAAAKKTITANEDEAIADILKKFTLSGSDYTAAERLGKGGKPGATGSGTDYQDKEEYGRSLREAREGYLAYLAEWDKRVEAQAKNARELELNALKNQKDQLLISEREYGDKVLAAKVAEATAAKQVEDRQYQEALARAATIESALKKQKDGTYADGYLSDGSRVGVQQYNEANKAAEAARIQKQAADARLAAAQQDQTAYSKINTVLDERAQKELDIQALSAQGLTLAAERMTNELKYADLMQKTGNAELVRRAKEVDDIKLANDLYAHQLALKQALDTLKSQNNMASASMVGVNDKGEFGSIADQTANALAVQQAEHAARMKMIEDERDANLDALMSGAKAYKDFTDTKNELDRKAALTERENTLKTAKIHSDAVKSQLSVTAMYAGMASDLFTSLAQTQDESSRSGFESAKSMNLAAAIASTAAAVMNQMAGGDPYTAFARATAAGALGAIQIAKIASTTYGGSGSAAPVSSGSFAASGGTGASGSAVGAQIRSVQDTQTEQSLRRLADASDNASLAIGKVANGLTSVADLFKTGYAKNMGAGLASGGYDSPSDMWVSEMANIKGTIKDGLGGLTGDLSSLFKSIGNTFLAPLNFLKNGIFGGSWYTSGAGISLGVQGGMFSGQSYTERTKDGGWFSGDKHRTDYSALDAGAQEVFSTYIAQIKSAIARAAVSTGTSTDFASAQVAAMNISTAGRSAEDIEKDLTEFFNTAANELAKTTSGLEQFSFYGENAFDALIRLSTSLQGVNEQLSLIGHTLIESTLQGADLAYRLADAFGGLDKMQEATDNYLSAMYSDHEREALKAAAAQREVNVAFAEMGRAVPQTREEFRALVDSLNLANDSATYVSLMNIAEAFGTVQEAADNAARDLLESQRDLQSRWLHATADADAGLYDLRIQQEQEIQDYIAKGLDTTRLLEVQAREYTNALSAKFKAPLIEAASSAANAIKSIMGGNLSTLSPEQQYKAQQAAFTNALANGQTSQLGTLGQSLLSSSRSYYGSGAQYAADYDMVMKALANVAGIADPTLEAAQKQIDLLQRISDNTSLYVTATTTLAQLMSQQLGIPVGLPRFATGGITRSMALAGEAGPEAVIPLPDGRTVPVTMQGGNDALIAEIKALREEVSELRKQSVGKLTDIEAPLRRVAARG